jgi:hypothetical protein
MEHARDDYLLLREFHYPLDEGVHRAFDVMGLGWSEYLTMSCRYRRMHGSLSALLVVVCMQQYAVK